MTSFLLKLTNFGTALCLWFPYYVLLFLFSRFFTHSSGFSVCILILTLPEIPGSDLKSLYVQKKTVYYWNFWNLSSISTTRITWSWKVWHSDNFFCYNMLWHWHFEKWNIDSWYCLFILRKKKLITCLCVIYLGVDRFETKAEIMETIYFIIKICLLISFLLLSDKKDMNNFLYWKMCRQKELILYH